MSVCIGKAKAWGSSLRLSTRIWFDVIPVTAFVLLLANSSPGEMLFTWKYVLIVGVVVFFHAAQTLFNDLADIEIDRQSTESNRNRRAFVEGRLTKTELVTAGCGLTLMCLVLSLFLPWPSPLLAFSAVPLALAYSFKPIYLAGRPILTQVFWPVMWSLIFFFCVTGFQIANWMDAFPYLLFVILFMGIGEGLTQDIRDFDNDKAGGRRTTIVAFGVQRCAVAAWIFQVLSVGAIVLLHFTGELPVLVTAASICVLIIWLIYHAGMVRRLRHAFVKRDARMTHVGSSVTFTIVNLILIFGALAKGGQ